MNNELNNLSIWFQANKLSLNLTKTNSILFHSKNMKHIIGKASGQLKVNDVIIKEVNSVKFLGLQIDKHLDWTDHYKNLHAKLSRANYMINSVKNFLPKQVLKTLYYSIFQSHLSYGLYLWGSTMLKRNLNKLIVLQKKAIRIISHAKYNAHTDELFVNLNILKVPDEIDCELLKLMYFHSKSNLPGPIQKLFTTNRAIHPYNTRRRDDPIIVQRNYSLLSNSFICKAPTLWSALDPVIKSCKTAKTFKKHIKQSKLRLY